MSMENIADIEVQCSILAEKVSVFVEDETLMMLKVDGAPMFSMGILPEDNSISVLQCRGDKVLCFSVEAPTESGAMTSYTPKQALEAIFDEVGIKRSTHGKLSFQDSFKPVGLEIRNPAEVGVIQASADSPVEVLPLDGRDPDEWYDDWSDIEAALDSTYPDVLWWE